MLTKSTRCPEYDGTNAIPITLLLRDWVGATHPSEKTTTLLRWRDANYTRFTDAMVVALGKMLTPDGAAKMHEFIDKLCLNYGEEHIIVHVMPRIYAGQGRPIISNGKKLTRFSYAKRTPSQDDSRPDYKGKHEEYLVLRTSAWEKP